MVWGGARQIRVTKLSKELINNTDVKAYIVFSILEWYHNVCQTKHGTIRKVGINEEWRKKENKRTNEYIRFFCFAFIFYNNKYNKNEYNSNTDFDYEPCSQGEQSKVLSSYCTNMASRMTLRATGIPIAPSSLCTKLLFNNYTLLSIQPNDSKQPAKREALRRLSQYMAKPSETILQYRLSPGVNRALTERAFQRTGPQHPSNTRNIV